MALFEHATSGHRINVYGEFRGYEIGDIIGPVEDGFTEGDDYELVCRETADCECPVCADLRALDSMCAYARRRRLWT